MASNGDRYLATSGDFFMATDNRPARGDCLGVVKFEVATRNGEPFKAERQLVPAYALRPRNYGA